MLLEHFVVALRVFYTSFYSNPRILETFMRKERKHVSVKTACLRERKIQICEQINVYINLYIFTTKAVIYIQIPTLNLCVFQCHVQQIIQKDSGFNDEY